MSTMIAGSVMPGGVSGRYQLMASAISAACSATIAIADELQRSALGVVGRIMQRIRVHGLQLRPSSPTSATLR